MSRPCTGNVYFRHGSWYARITLAAGVRPTLQLPTCADEPSAEERARLLTTLVERLKAVGRADLAPDLIRRAAQADADELVHVVVGRHDDVAEPRHVPQDTRSLVVAGFATVALLAGGLGSWAVTALPGHAPSFFAFVWAALLPYACRLAGESGPLAPAMALTTLLYAVGLSLAIGVLSQTFPYAIMDRMHVEGAASAQYTGPAMTMGAMATLISQLVLIPRMKLPIRSLMVYGAIMMAMSSLFMVWAQDFALFAFAQIMFGFGQGFGRPGFSAGASLAATHEQQGDVAGLITAANGMGFVVSPFFGLWMYENVSSEAPFIFCAALVVLIAVYAFFTAKGGERGKNKAVADAVAKDNTPE